MKPERIEKREELIVDEPPPWEQPAKPKADEDALERIERKLDELPASVAIAVGGHPAEEAEQALADADAERGLW